MFYINFFLLFFVAFCSHLESIMDNMCFN